MSIVLVWTIKENHKLRISNQKEQRDTEERIKEITAASVSEVHRLYEGLGEIDVQNVFKIATQFIADAKYIRVIGTAKQNYTELNNMSAIEDYLESTILRSRQDKYLKYRRITSININNNFLSHLTEILENGQNSENHDSKVMILNDFIPAYTYLIIDEKFLMLSLNFEEQKGTTKHYYSQNYNTIQNFITHFKSVWSNQKEINKVIENSTALDYYFKFRKQTHKSLESIRKKLNCFPDFGTYSQEHVIEELQQTEERIKDISNGISKLVILFPTAIYSNYFVFILKI